MVRVVRGLVRGLVRGKKPITTAWSGWSGVWADSYCTHKRLRFPSKRIPKNLQPGFTPDHPDHIDSIGISPLTRPLTRPLTTLTIQSWTSRNP